MLTGIPDSSNFRSQRRASSSLTSRLMVTTASTRGKSIRLNRKVRICTQKECIRSISNNSTDRKETFNFHYDPEFDPAHKQHLNTVPQHVKDHLPKDSMIWAPSGISEFKETILGHYEQCLATARRLIRLIALGLDLPEDYFDRLTSYPGADFGLVFYPGHGEDKIEDLEEVGLGAHTDLQILTLLWQDENKGLQILNNNHEWVFAPSIPGTLVVNIGDFLMRLTNDQLKSTVHRVIQHGKNDRYSMPFFFGR